MAMQRVRQRILELKDRIDEAQDRETKAQNAIRETEARLDKLEGEKAAIIGRIHIVQSDLDKTSMFCEESSSKLEETLARSEVAEERRQVLTEHEYEGFERVEMMENQLKATKEAREASEHLLVEGERKEVVLKQRLSEASERYEKFLGRVEELSTIISDNGVLMRELEEKDRDSGEREYLNEEKVRFLQDQLQEEVSKAEALERVAERLERLHDVVRCEIDQCIAKKEESAFQLQQTLDSLSLY